MRGVNFDFRDCSRCTARDEKGILGVLRQRVFDFYSHKVSEWESPFLLCTRFWGLIAMLVHALLCINFHSRLKTGPGLLGVRSTQALWSCFLSMFGNRADHCLPSLGVSILLSSLMKQ